MGSSEEMTWGIDIDVEIVYLLIVIINAKIVNYEKNVIINFSFCRFYRI